MNFDFKELNKDRYFFKQLFEEIKAAITNGEIYYDSAEKLTDLLQEYQEGLFMIGDS